MAQYLSGQTSWTYLKILVGNQFRVGMTEYNMLFILAGPSAKVGDQINDLLRKWNGSPAKSGMTSWDWVRMKCGSLFQTGDSINDMLRKMASAYLLEPVNAAHDDPEPQNPAPVLSAIGVDLSWTYSGIQPRWWMIFNVTRNEEEGFVEGNLHSYVAQFPGSTYYVLGTDADENAITPQSNSVVS